MHSLLLDAAAQHGAYCSCPSYTPGPSIPCPHPTALTKLEKGLNLNWNTTSPMANVINPDFWGGRFTFYWQVGRVHTGIPYMQSQSICAVSHHVNTMP